MIFKISYNKPAYILSFFVKIRTLFKRIVFAINILPLPFLRTVDIIGMKPAPGDQESNFKKVGAIPCGCNTKLASAHI